MYVVALTELATPLEDEAAELAAHLGTTLYEERLNLNGGLPAIVLRTADRKEAATLLAAVRSRGHDAVACDVARLVSSSAMVPMRGFALEPDALRLPDRPSERLPYADISVLLRATHRTRTETQREVKGKQFSLGRAVATGGLLLTKSVSREERSVANDRDQVLYVFRASGGVPWLLRERATSYAGLGRDCAPSSFQNFLTTIARLRERAPQAAYDERLMAPRNVTGRTVRSTGVSSESVSVSSASGVDLLAHLLALWLGQRGPQPSMKDSPVRVRITGEKV